MTPNEKLAFVKEQIINMQREGKEHELSCPYCLSVIPIGAGPCCMTFFRAVSAIMEAQETLDRIDQAQRILERASRQ